MAIRLPRIMQAASRSSHIPKGCCGVYVGEIQKKRFVNPISIVNLPSFQELLSEAEEEFGFSHPTGGLTIPCSKDMFFSITGCLQKKQ